MAAVPLALLAAGALAWRREAALLPIRRASVAAPVMPGDRVLVERWPYRHRLPRRGDLVVLAPVTGGNGLAVVLALPGERLRAAADRLSLDERPLPRWRVADAAVPADAPAGLSRIRQMALFPDGRLLRLPPLPAGEWRVEPGMLLLLDAAGRVFAHPVVGVAGRAGPVLVSFTGAGRWRRPATWPHALRPSRTGLPLGAAGAIG